MANDIEVINGHINLEDGDFVLVRSENNLEYLSGGNLLKMIVIDLRSSMIISTMAFHHSENFNIPTIEKA